MRIGANAGLYLVAMFALAASLPLSGQGKFNWNWKSAEELGPNQRLRYAGMPATEQALLEEAITDQLRRSELAMASGRLHEFALDARIAKVQLKTSSRTQFVVQGSDPFNCSPTGNCPFWVFEKRRNTYAMLLKSFGQVYTVQAHRTNGYSDLVVATHGSAFERTVHLYRFQAGRYEETTCYEFIWPLSDEPIPKEPTIEPCR